MSFLDFIQHLQQKPEPARKQIVIAAATVFTLLIGGAWFYNLTSSLEQISGNKSASEQNASLLTPFQNLKKDFSDIKSKTGAAFSNLTETLKQASQKNETEIEIKNGASDNNTEKISKPLKLPVDK